MITNEDNIQISTYHVKKGATLNISFSDDGLSHNIVVIYIVLSGQIEVCEAASSKIVNANEMIILHPQNNFLIVVKEEANLICINNKLYSTILNECLDKVIQDQLSNNKEILLDYIKGKYL